MNTHRPTYREIEADLLRRGWTIARTRGSHRTMTSPEGRSITLIVNHMGDTAQPMVLVAYRRAVRE